MVDEKNFRDPMYEDPTPRQQGNTLSPASRHEHPDSSTSSSEIPYPNSHREESIMNLDLEKGGVEHPVQDVLNNDEKDEFSSSEDKENVGDPNLVDWEGPDDPAHPQNWSFAKKARITISLGVMTLTVTFASSVFSTATKAVSEEFGISTEVATLGTSLFVLGYALGPIVWGPFSELYGRTIPFFIGYGVFLVFQIPVAVAQNVETIMLSRFIGGCFSCAPLVIGGGLLSDFWSPLDRGIAVSVWSGAIFIGPTLGPIVGGFITQSSLGWRWTAWITLIMGAALGMVGLLFIPETYPAVLLQRKAKKIRFETKNWAIHSKLDESQVDFKVILETYLLRPFKMLMFEPILLLITIYLGLIYGILYLFFEAFPISFQEKRHWNGGIGALPFISIILGTTGGAITITIMTRTRFARKMRENNGKVVPEERLIAMIIGSFILPAGLFWFGWTSSPSISWVPQVLAGIAIGWGIFLVFLQGFNYIIDVYLQYAASAIAANTMFRSFFGAAFPLFATQMYTNLGVPWASSTLAFLCIALIPAPICFYLYGEKLRKMSRFSPTA